MVTLGGCSTKPSAPRMPALPANLAADCPGLPALPEIMADPPRAVWELQIIAVYADCASRHRATVSAWPKR
jgi:hypothetical protein